ncbi:unnamed protein product [Lymnaea stagnalis]|uniref:EF-hand domain-containing protein n=1 Tax=Lymnaea stagnalis TaxID=6523 RepID=A0AAV2HQ62_LYMST
MAAPVFLLVSIFCTAAAQTGSINFDNLFRQYAGTDNVLQRNEFDRFWLHLDENTDGSVSKQEFDIGWRDQGFPNPQNAPLYFIELDRVADEHLNSLDFPHIFKLFDENANGFITEREARYNWNAYFE